MSSIVIIRRNRCLLCQIELETISDHGGVQGHPKAADCRVTHTDAWGVALTDEEIRIFETLRADFPEAEPEMGVFDLHPPVERVLGELFDSYGLARLGGASTGKGWSSFAVAQRCLFLWHKRYVERSAELLVCEPEGLAVGTLVHAFLALFYANQIGDYKAITPEIGYEYLLTRANPNFVKEGWRVFTAYRLYHAFDDFRPLAVEYDLKDPRTGESTRYDAIIYYPRSKPGRLAGTYIMEHKTAGRFDYDTIESWANDGEVIGEAALWRRLGLDHRFGPLRGVIINICGKQKEPKFHRTLVAPQPPLIAAHLDDLRRWDGLLQFCKATDNWPRSRANCINRYGRCDLWEHCVSGAP